MKRFGLIVFLVSLLLGSMSFAASFDCGTAKTAAEKLICSDGELSELDSTLAKSYNKALVNAIHRAKLEESQQTWVAKRRDACGNADCMKRAYKERLKELNADSSSSGSAAAGPEFRSGGQTRIRFNSSHGN